MQRRVSPLPELVSFIDSSHPLTSAQLQELETLLTSHGTLQISTTYVDWEDTDGEKHHLPTMKAAGTGMWPMGTNWYARDNVLIPVRLLEVGQLALGKELLTSALTMFSTQSQLARFRGVVEATDSDFVHQRENWPQVFLTIQDNLNGSRYESWSHKQDAWQMLAYHTLQLIEKGLFSVQDLTVKHKEFLGLVLPFLAKIQFWKEGNGGSWEELEARRTSVMTWDTVTIAKIAQFAQRSEGAFLIESFEQAKRHLQRSYQALSLSETAKALVAEGNTALQKRLPYECPDYDKTDARYRAADAALIYLLQLGMPEFLGKPGLESDLITQIERLTDLRTGAIRRYLNDSYQGMSFFRNEIVFYLSEVYGAPSGDASGAEQWVNRRKVVPAGPEAAWTLFVWQMSAWSGKRYVETHEPRYLELQNYYFKRGLKLITGNNEVSVEQSLEGPMRMFSVPAWRIPEAYITDEGPTGEELIFPSPHTPLNWAVGEAIYALAMMTRSLAA